MTPLKLTVIGCGYLGAVHAAAMAHLGHHVLGIDTRPEQVEALSDEAAEASVGAARGAAVVPGLDEATVAAHRAARELEDDEPFATVSDDEPADADAPAGSAAAPETAERTASAETTVIDPVEAPVPGAESEEPETAEHAADDDTTETEPAEDAGTEADAEDSETHDGEEDA